ncbi:unnamed protein product [Prorocentrum cordatum]|uniref:Uncharacterized protein n=1 Tax=Prorocentrum cordatum TaxID=2364126 RepID=A0ABN9S419_9DINO|nr:unnamed protein product [Polarella glacialis]|mmetsp:Transcript_115179/g.326737  ORF Transcript_115179/g.326737 Transcript_115179/m.326737 type:complete len:138 (-) Transcript_115179:227-640(-)
MPCPFRSSPDADGFVHCPICLAVCCLTPEGGSLIKFPVFGLAQFSFAPAACTGMVVFPLPVCRDFHGAGLSMVSRTSPLSAIILILQILRFPRRFPAAAPQASRPGMVALDAIECRRSIVIMEESLLYFSVPAHLGL